MTDVNDSTGSNGGSPPHSCPLCGGQIPPGGPQSLCPRCLLRGGLDYADTPPASSRQARGSGHPRHFGPYQVLEVLGEGGMACVFRAQRGPEDDVALKTIRPGLAACADSLERFRTAVELAGKLEHPNIIRVYDRSGLYENPPYYTMQLAARGTLADEQNLERFRDPARAARLMIRIARAVQFAHEHGVLHRDLKPGNILLDCHDRPYVSDFMAKRIDRRAERTGHRGASSIVGTLPYMSPEQAAGEATTSVDVYGLGAIFYELLTGRPPHEVHSIEELRDRHQTQSIAPPSAHAPGLSRELEAVCMAALERDPARRFRSAADFADSLRCVLDERPPPWPPTPRHRWLVLWAQRHPLLAISAVLGTLLLLATDIATLAGTRSERDGLRMAALHGCAKLASAQAGMIFAVLETYSEYAIRAASDPAIQALLASPRANHEIPPVLRELQERARFRPDSVFLLNAEGELVVRGPTIPADFVGEGYDFRDYYKCAKRLANSGSVCISPLYWSEVHQGVQFALSSPVYDASGTLLGVVVLSKNAARTFADVDFDDLNGTGQITGLFGFRGADRDKAGDPTKMIAVFHRGLRGDTEKALDVTLVKRLRDRFKLHTAGGNFFAPVDVTPIEDNDYRDPVGDPRERWLAAFAPVGRTGYVLVVAIPHERALEPSRPLFTLLTMYGGLLNLGFLVICAIAVWASLRGTPPLPMRDED